MIVSSVLPLYLTLLMVNKLPSGEFWKDIVSVGLVALGTSVVAGMCPCIGLFIAIYILHSVYDMEFLDFIVLVGLNAVIGVVASVIVAAIFGIPVMRMADMVGGMM